MELLKNKVTKEQQNINTNKKLNLTQYILQGGVRWYANCGFSHRSSVSFGQERSPKSAPQHVPTVSTKQKRTRMHKLTIILISLVYGLNGICQNDTALIKIESKDIDSVLLSKPIENEYDEVAVLDALQGKMADPIICNELGFEIIGGTEIPNFGLSLDYNPLFLKRYIGSVGYRNNFNKSHIFNASIESKYLFNKYPRHYDFKVAYERFAIDKSDLKDYYKISYGPIYRMPWTSFGLFFGQDSYEKQLGVDFYFKYRFHKLILGSENEYKSKYEFETLIGYWDNELTSKFNLRYLINFNYSCGLGYRKQYDFEEVYLTFRYLLCH